ncbi:MAG: hypothetical protein D3903_07620 [Candidatus Electrothrix sp. GM3_4]|nr:hypothetical protein [Candidatus Electrothrix sp. GM3_4]
MEIETTEQKIAQLKQQQALMKELIKKNADESLIYQQDLIKLNKPALFKKNLPELNGCLLLADKFIKKNDIELTLSGLSFLKNRLKFSIIPYSSF